MIRSLEIYKFVYHNYNLSKTRISSRIYGNVCHNRIKFPVRYCSTDLDSSYDVEEQNKSKKKTVRIPNIKLVFPDGSMNITALEEAEKISRSRKYHLVKESYLDADKRDVYKLLDNKSFFGSLHNKNTKKKDIGSNKGTKLFHIYSKISERDLEIKLKNVNKVLQKNFRVKLAISFPSDDINKETMLKNLKKMVQGELIEENKKGPSLVFIYKPLLIESSKSDENIS
ncbi:uncharacterized protein LOC144470088 isoform X1 [Augochlora pura]